METGRSGFRRLVRGMAGRQTNLALLYLLTLAIVTGALNFALGTGWARWPTVAHGVTSLGLLVLAYWKWRIARAGLERRRPGSTWPSVVLGGLVVIALVSGILHATGLVLTYGPLDDMQVHVGAALLAVPFAAWHLVARSTYPRRQDVSRRNLLRSGLLLGSAGVVYVALEGLIEAARLPGRQRRLTGSFEEGSHDPERMPSIVWLFDPRPVLDPDAWRLTISANGVSRTLTYADLDGADRLTATLDCTSGWWAEQDWSGVRLERLLGPLASDTRSLVVRSHTGYTRRFPVEDLPRLLLATHYEGRPIAARHGAPARLVAPGRRGFWWVKWVVAIEASSRPWWQQPPYPLR